MIRVGVNRFSKPRKALDLAIEIRRERKEYPASLKKTPHPGIRPLWSINRSNSGARAVQIKGLEELNDFNGLEKRGRGGQKVCKCLQTCMKCIATFRKDITLVVKGMLLECQRKRRCRIPLYKVGAKSTGYRQRTNHRAQIHADQRRFNRRHTLTYADRITRLRRGLRRAKQDKRDQSSNPQQILHFSFDHPVNLLLKICRK
jgi:hypothetical protein